MTHRDFWTEMTTLNPNRVGQVLFNMISQQSETPPHLVGAAFALGFISFLKMYPAQAGNVLQTAENYLQRTHGMDEEARQLVSAVSFLKGEFSVGSKR